MYSKNTVALGGVLGGLKIRRIDDLHFLYIVHPHESHLEMNRQVGVGGYQRNCVRSTEPRRATSSEDF